MSFNNFKNYQNFSAMGSVTEPEAKYTDAGKMYTKFSVIYNKFVPGVNGADGTNVPMFVQVTSWEKDAEFVSKHVHKGDVVFVEGELNFDHATGAPRIWAANDGSARATFEVFPHKIVVVSKKDGNGSNGTQTNPANGQVEAPVQGGFTTAQQSQPQAQPQYAPQPTQPQPGGFAPQAQPQYQPQPGYANQQPANFSMPQGHAQPNGGVPQNQSQQPGQPKSW